MNPVYVNSKITGGHYAFQREGSKKPFENPMSGWNLTGCWSK